MRPLTFSVVIPTYDRQAALSRCLQSVTSQDYPDYEVIVVDDGSQDDTAKMIEVDFPGVFYFRQEANGGPAAARNRGIEAARGQIIAFTDDDCLPPADWLSSFAAGFDAYPQAGAIGGLQEPPEDLWQQNLLARFERYRTRKVYQLGNEVKLGYPLPVGTNNLAIKKDLLLQVGGFDPSFPVAAGEDADLLHRLADLGYPTVCLPFSVTHHQAYTWTSFVKQQYLRGVGAAYFQAKRGLLRSPLIETLSLLPLPVLFFRDFLRSRSVLLAIVSIISRLLQAIGRITTQPKIEKGLSGQRRKLDPPFSENAPGEKTAGGNT